MRTLAEDLLLLALDDEKGTVSWEHATALPYGLGGALLMDLVSAERVALVDGKVALVDESPMADDVLDAALRSLADDHRLRDARHWVEKLGRKRGLKQQLARRLVERGILRESEHTLLRVFHDTRFPASDPGPEAALGGRLRDVVMGGAEADDRTLVLLSLLHACDLAGGLFPSAERKQAKRRVAALVQGEQLGKTVSRAVAEAEAVIIAAVVASTMVTVTASQ
jgi:hypothetical protein